MRNLSIRHKVYIAYFALVWPLLAINNDAPLWAIVLIVLNLGNAARLIMQVPLKEVN